MCCTMSTDTVATMTDGYWITRYTYSNDAASGYSFKQADNLDLRKGISVKIARLHSQFQQESAPSMRFSGGLFVRDEDWLPQGQSIREKRALDETRRGRAYVQAADSAKVSLHWWPIKSSWNCINSTFFVMRLDTRRVMDAVHVAAMNKEALTKFAKLIADSFEPIQVPTPAGYKLEKAEIAYTSVYHCHGFCSNTAECVNEVGIKVDQQIQKYKNSPTTGPVQFKGRFTHTLQIFGYANNERLVVVGRGEGWRVLQRFACKTFGIEFGRKILSARSWRKDAQLDLLESQQCNLEYPSGQHVKGFMAAECDFHKKLIALENFKLCNVYHHEDLSYNLSNNNFTDSSSGGEEEFEFGSGVKSSNLLTLPIKVGIGQGLVKICVPVHNIDFRNIADYISANIADYISATLE